MKIHFDSCDFDSYLLRTLSYSYYGGADIGECLITAKKSHEDNPDTWFEAWYETGNRVFELGLQSASKGNRVHAREAFLRSSIYFRTAFAFHMHAEGEGRLKQGYERHVQSFNKALEYFDINFETLSIPYRDWTIPGILYFSPECTGPAPLLIVYGGPDHTYQEAYFFLAAAALRQGFHVLCFDGPGQGDLLIRQRCPMTVDSDIVLRTILDTVLPHPLIDSKQILLCGMSWGALLAERAAAYDPRISGLVVNPGQMDALQSLESFVPSIRKMLNDNEKTQIHQVFENIFADRYLGKKFRSFLWVHGVSKITELLEEWSHYHVRDCISQIRCPTFVADAENETLNAGQAKQFFDALECPKEYALFKDCEGAGQHCENGALSLFHQKMFDWWHGLKAKENELVASSEAS